MINSMTFPAPAGNRRAEPEPQHGRPAELPAPLPHPQLRLGAELRWRIATADAHIMGVPPTAGPAVGVVA